MLFQLSYAQQLSIDSLDPEREYYFERTRAILESEVVRDFVRTRRFNCGIHNITLEYKFRENVTETFCFVCAFAHHVYLMSLQNTLRWCSLEHQKNQVFCRVKSPMVSPTAPNPNDSVANKNYALLCVCCAWVSLARCRQDTLVTLDSRQPRQSMLPG